MLRECREKISLKTCWKMKLNQGKKPCGCYEASYASYICLMAVGRMNTSHPPLTTLKSDGKAHGFRFHALCN